MFDAQFSLPLTVIVFEFVSESRSSSYSAVEGWLQMQSTAPGSATTKAEVLSHTSETGYLGSVDPISAANLPCGPVFDILLPTEPDHRISGYCYSFPEPFHS